MKNFLVGCKNNNYLYPEVYNQIGQEFDTCTCTALSVTDDTLVFFVDGSINSSEIAVDGSTWGGSDGSSTSSGSEDPDREDIPLRECYLNDCACTHRCDCPEYEAGSKCACQHDWNDNIAVEGNNNCTSCGEVLKAGDVVQTCDICSCKTHNNDRCIPLDHGNTPESSDSESD